VIKQNSDYSRVDILLIKTLNAKHGYRPGTKPAAFWILTANLLLQEQTQTGI